MSIRIAGSEEELRRCFRVMRQLRTHLSEEDFLARVSLQGGEGYRLAYVESEGAVLAVAGYRILEMLAHGRFLYVDDLVSEQSARSRGHGKCLLSWLCDEAKRLGCESLQLDSGVQREAAHRFYEREGLELSSYHFRIGVGESQ